MRVSVDTNILLSALINPRGYPHSSLRNLAIVLPIIEVPAAIEVLPG